MNDDEVFFPPTFFRYAPEFIGSEHTLSGLLVAGMSQLSAALQSTRGHLPRSRAELSRSGGHADPFVTPMRIRPVLLRLGSRQRCARPERTIVAIRRLHHKAVRRLRPERSFSSALVTGAASTRQRGRLIVKGVRRSRDQLRINERCSGSASRSHLRRETNIL